MESPVRQCFARAIWPRLNFTLKSRTYAWTRPVNAQCGRQSRPYFKKASAGHQQQASLWSKTTWPNQQKSRMFSTLPAPSSCSLARQKRSGDGVFGLGFTKSMTSEATAEDSEAYRSALPFKSVPTVGGLQAIPYIGMRFLFKPFSKYSIEGLGHVINELHDSHGPIFRIRMGKDWWVFTDNLHDADIALRSEMEFPYREPISIIEVYNKRAEKPWITLGILNGQEWKRMRSPMNVRMNRPNSVIQYLPSQEEVAGDFAHKLYHRQRDSPSKVLSDLFFSFATESIGVVCYNKRLGFLAEDFELDSRKQKLLESYLTNMRSLGDVIMKKQQFMFKLF